MQVGSDIMHEQWATRLHTESWTFSPSSWLKKFHAPLAAALYWAPLDRLLDPRDCASDRQAFSLDVWAVRTECAQVKHAPTKRPDTTWRSKGAMGCGQAVSAWPFDWLLLVLTRCSIYYLHLFGTGISKRWGDAARCHSAELPLSVCLGKRRQSPYGTVHDCLFVYCLHLEPVLPKDEVMLPNVTQQSCLCPFVSEI